MRRSEIIAAIEKIAAKLEKAPAEIERSAKDLYDGSYPYRVGGLEQTMTSTATDLRLLLARMAPRKQS